MEFLMDQLESVVSNAIQHGEDYDPSAPNQARAPTVQTYPATKTYYILLEGPINTTAKVQQLGQLPHLPEIVQDESGTDATFCVINGSARTSIEQRLSASFNPTFIAVNKASKDLSVDSWAPLLGYDCTPPQHRPPAAPMAVRLESAMTQFPVWYYFYGMLAEQEWLGKVIGRDVDKVELTPARVCGGAVLVWESKYKALVDGPGKMVLGKALEVRNQEEEDALPVYETDQYEVVRCSIEMEGRSELWAHISIC